MSFLTPLFLALGVAAVTVPVLLHLLRPTPRRPRLFSAVQFLDHAPTWTVRRRRMEDWPLFVVRGLILCALGAAFARPLLTLLAPEPPARHVVFVLDASAGMRRGDLFEQARRHVAARMGALRPSDAVSLATFDARLSWAVRAEDLRTMPAAARREAVQSRLKSLEPGWRLTDFDAVIAHLADCVGPIAIAPSTEAGPLALSATGRPTRGKVPPPDEIVIVSDFAGRLGERLSQLLESRPLPLQVVQLETPGATNGGLQPVAVDLAETSTDAERTRVRVTNSSASLHGDFRIEWQFESETGARELCEVAVHVPPGQRRIVTAPVVAEMRPIRVALAGDNHDFDNSLEIAPPHVVEATVVWLGADRADDPAGMRYYVERAFPPSAALRVRIAANDEGIAALTADPAAALAIVTGTLPSEVTTALIGWVAQGGQVLIAPRTAEALTVAGALRNSSTELIASDGPNAPAVRRPLTVNPITPALARAEPGEWALQAATLTEIDFAHPLFAPFAGPRYGDFSKIHFWNRGTLDAFEQAGDRVLARFDDGRPALIEFVRGEGRVLVLAAGWHPDDSQLARSSRFAPLLNQLLRLAPRCRRAESNVAAGDAVSVRALAGWPPGDLLVQTPAGLERVVATTDGEFKATDEPGRYTIVVATSGSVGATAKSTVDFCVHIPASETETAPLSDDAIRGLSSLTTGRGGVAASAKTSDLMGKTSQPWWRGMILAALALIAVETAVANRRRAPSVHLIEPSSAGATVVSAPPALPQGR